MLLPRFLADFIKETIFPIRKFKDMRTTLKRLVSNDPFADIPENAVLLGGIVGGTKPSQYSRSPGLWNRFFEVLGLKGKYLAFDLDRKEDLPAFLKTALEMPGFRDLTITKPYKALSFKLLPPLFHKTEITDRARILESLNQLIRDPVSRTIIVDRTDGAGFVRALKKRAALPGKKVLFIGSGGTALSVCFELIREDAELTIVDLVPDDAHRIGAVLASIRKRSQKLTVSSDWDAIKELAASSDIIIGAMPGITPFEPDAIRELPENCLFADIHYSAEKAAFAAAVRKAGRVCVDGLQMRYGQFRFAAERCAGFLGFSPEMLEKHLDAIEEWFLAENP